MKVLILGGTGAMGVPLSKQLAKDGNKVYVTTRMSRVSDTQNIYYLKGNAHDINFIKKLLNDRKYDAIVDFMIYTVEELQERIDFFLHFTGHYVFLSSSRVYANEEVPIRESSPRLLDVCEDEKYLAQKEYALEKARQENILFSNEYKNWTIIRPYITYFTERLQLGVLEKEHWLYRALQGRTIVFSKDIAKKFTTLTYGGDVGDCITRTIGNNQAFGKAINCVSSQSVRWEQLLEIYLDAIERYTGKRPKVLMTDEAIGVARVLNNNYQICYDRLYDRSFDNTIVHNILGKDDYVTIGEGIDRCLKEFLNGEMQFRPISWNLEGYYNRLTKEHISLSEFPSWKKMVKYILLRYFNFNL